MKLINKIPRISKKMWLPAVALFAVIVAVFSWYNPQHAGIQWFTKIKASLDFKLPQQMSIINIRRKDAGKAMGLLTTMIIVAFIAFNFINDRIIARKKMQKEIAKVAERQERSSTPRISRQQYLEQKDEYSKNSVKRLINSAEYKEKFGMIQEQF